VLRVSTPHWSRLPFRGSGRRCSCSRGRKLYDLHDRYFDRITADTPTNVTMATARPADATTYGNSLLSSVISRRKVTPQPRRASLSRPGSVDLDRTFDINSLHMLRKTIAVHAGRLGAPK